MDRVMLPSTSLPGGPVRAAAPPTLRDLVTMVVYHRWIMLIAFLLPVLAGLGAAAIARPAYVAQARLLVLYGGEYFYRPAGQPGGSIALDRNEIMLGELQVLQSTTLALGTLEKLGVDHVYPGTPPGDRAALDRAALRLGRDLTVATIPQSNVLELSFRSHDPQVAADVLRALIAGYLERRAAIFQRATTTIAQDDRAAFLARLHQAEDALGSFADAHGIFNVDQQMVLLLQQQAGNRLARSDTAQALSETTASLAALQTQVAHLAPDMQIFAESERSQTSQVLTESLTRLQVKRRDLAARYQDDFPAVQDVDRQIAALRSELAQAPAREAAVTRRGVNPLYQTLQGQQIGLQSQLAGLQAKAAQLAAAATVIDSRILDLGQAARQYRDLVRNRDLLDEAYRNLAHSYDEAQIGDAAERGRTANVRVVQPPERPAVGVSLRRVLVGGGIAVGLLAALAALALANACRRVFVTTRDLTVALDLPVLVAIDRPAGGASPRTGPRKPAPPSAWIELTGQGTAPGIGPA
jgi:uncharacterized protein involved in exopolysaccharide biosynthesis